MRVFPKRAPASVQPSARGIAGPSEPDVLELRIHGVSNTPAADMLDLSQDEIHQVSGDTLGGFWAPTTAAAAQGAGLPPEDEHHIAPGVRREAYSWGLLARTSPGGAGRALGVVGAVAVRLGWALLIPFGLANAAYWSRPIPVPGTRNRGWRDAKGAAELRVFALALTLLVVASVSAVSLELIAVQCYPGAPGATVARCDQLPTVMDALATWSRGERLALASLVPVLILVGLFWLSRSGQVRYERRMSRTAAQVPGGARRSGPQAPPQRPVLATPGFWHNRTLGVATSRLHLAAGLSLIALVLAWDEVYGLRRGCGAAATFFGSTCRAGLAQGWTRDDQVAAGFGVVAIALLVVVVCRVCVDAEACADVSVRTGRPPRRYWSGWLLLAAVGEFAGTVVLRWAPWAGAARRPEPAAVLTTLDGLVASARPASSESILGLVAAPSVLVALLVGLAIAGLGWRRGVGAGRWLSLLMVGAGCLLLATFWPSTGAGWVRSGAWGGVVLALAAQVCAVWRGGPRHPATGEVRTPGARRFEAWAGAGPGIFMLLAAGAAMTLNGLLVSGTAAWLNTTTSAVSVSEPSTGPGLACIKACALPMRPLVVPPAYREFGAAAVLVLVLALIAFGVLALARRGPAPIPPAPGSGPDAVGGADPGSDPGGPPAPVDDQTKGDVEVLRGRRLAALTQLAEPVIAVVAVSMGAALLGTLVPSRWLPGWALLESAGNWALGAAALAVVGAAVTGSLKQTGRPLGLVWDVMCFLPRVAHPFGPPSYAERVVPELRERVEQWLGDPAGANRGTRRVVLSAHSLGAVLAVACVLARDKGDSGSRRVGLLTYGSQLRPYFGRFFPELLGPDTLGTASCRAPDWKSPDPWHDEVSSPPRPALPALGDADDTVVRRVGGRRGPGGTPAWINLWRRTDFIGFPAVSYGSADENPVDRGAEEVDRTGYLFTVASHGGYPRALVYHEALDEVLGRMAGPIR